MHTLRFAQLDVGTIFSIFPKAIRIHAQNGAYPKIGYYWKLSATDVYSLTEQEFISVPQVPCWKVPTELTILTTAQWGHLLSVPKFHVHNISRVSMGVPGVLIESYEMGGDVCFLELPNQQVAFRCYDKGRPMLYNLNSRSLSAVCPASIESVALGMEVSEVCHGVPASLSVDRTMRVFDFPIKRPRKQITTV